MPSKKRKNIKARYIDEVNNKSSNKLLSVNNLLYSILGTGLLIRIFFLFEINNSPFADTLFSDSLIYFENAERMLKNNYFFGHEVFYMSPLYTYFLSVLQFLFSDSILIVRLLQVIVSTATIAVVFLIGKNLHSEKTGLIAAAICSLYGLFVYYSGVVLIETLQTFLLSLFFFQLTRESRYFENKHWFLTGLLLGSASILRASVLIFFPVVVIWLLIYFKTKQFGFKVYYRSVFFFFVGCFVTILPITMQNFLAEKDFVLITSNGGINFFMGNNPNATGIYQMPKEFDLALDLTGKKYAEKELNRKLSASEVSSYWYSRGMDFILSEPIKAAELYFKKILLFFSEDENAQSFIMDLHLMKKDYSVVLNLTLPGFFLILIFAIAGVLLHPDKNHIYYFLIVLLAVYILTSAVFFVVGRFRLIVTPLIIVFSAVGISELWKIISKSEFTRLKTTIITILVFLSLNFTITPKFTFTDSDIYVFLGNSYFQKKQFDVALEYFNKAIELKNDASTLVLIANTYSAKKDVNNAMINYRKAVDLNPHNVLAYFNVGILYTELGSFPDAIRAFNKAIEIDPEYLAAYKNLAIIYYISEDYKNSLYYFEKVLKMSRDKEEQATVLQDIQNIKKKLSGNNN